MKMPHRGGLPDGLIAVWGKITLEPLEQESIKILADGKGPRKGLLIDFLGNFARSAKEGLPIYHIDGGPGFIWAASFDQKECGTLRLAAVELSGFPYALINHLSILHPLFGEFEKLLALRSNKASEMAGREIDLLGDPSATDEERQLRKQRLIKGPQEFRDIRSNRATI